MDVRPTYQSVAADIIKVSAVGDTPEAQETVAEMCRVFTEFLQGFIVQTNGYMAMAAFIVSFTEMKKVIHFAEPQDKELIYQLMLAVIGSFGRNVQ